MTKEKLKDFIDSISFDLGIKKEFTLVNNFKDLSSLVSDIQIADFVSLDTETTGLNPRHDKIIGISFTTSLSNGYYIPILRWNRLTEELEDIYIEHVKTHDLAKSLIERFIKDKKLLIAHNAKFDLRIIKNNFGIDLRDDLWVDTIMLIHTLHESGLFFPNNSVTGYFSLKEVSQIVSKEIGFSDEDIANQEQLDLKESIVNNGGIVKGGFELYKADMDKISKYACADTNLTYRICFHFLKELYEQELYEFFFDIEVMPLYKYVTSTMEEKGVRIDIEAIKKSIDEILVDIELTKKSIVSALLEYPQFKTWVVQRASEEFPASKTGTFAKSLYKKNILGDINSTQKFSLSAKNIDSLPDSPTKSFLQTGNLSFLDEMVDILPLQLDLWEKKSNGYININSKDQMGEFVFGHLGIKPISATKKGKPQFNEDFVESISDQFEWAKQFRIYNKLYKIYSSYMLRLLEGSEDGRYYFYYKQNGTVSGRYGSDAQQFPRPKEKGDDEDIIVYHNNKIRSFMIADPGRIFIDCDYESLEPRVFSHVSGDEALREIFSSGADFYSTIAIKAENLKNISPFKSDPNYLKTVSPMGRHRAKFYSLGIPYGMQAYALSKLLDIPIKEAKSIITGYLNGFPSLKQWMIDSRKKAVENGYIKSEAGRIRHLGRVKEIYESLGDSLEDYNFRKKLSYEYGSKEVLGLYRDWKNGINSAYNHQIQSLAASIVNQAAIAVSKAFEENNIDGWVCAQIHDQLIFDVKDDKDRELAKELVQYHMENTIKISIDLKAPPEFAHNWLEGH